jgi:hypothetical protein
MMESVAVSDAERVALLEPLEVGFALPSSWYDDEGIVRRKARFDSNAIIPDDVAIRTRVQLAHAAGLTPPERLLPGSKWLLQHFQRVLIEMATETKTTSAANSLPYQ